MADNTHIIIHKNDIPDLISANVVKVDQAVGALAQDGRRFIQQGMKNSPPTGNVYMKPSGVSHTASSPGNMPRIDDGILVNSFYIRYAGRGVRIIGTSVEYGLHLEFGTSEIEARPFMGPMVGHLKSIAKGFFEDLIED